MATRVILVRHGESSYNVERRVQGVIDESTITERGRETARMVGDALKDMVFDAAYSSPLRRAKDTADCILERLVTPPKTPLQTRDILKEINLALWEGLLFTDVQAQFPDEYRLWREQPDQMKMTIADPDCEPRDFYPVPDLFERATNFWKETLPQHADQTLLIVGHSGINRALISTALGIPSSCYQSVNQSNCGISVLNFLGGWGDTVQLESLNLTGHVGQPLPKPKQEFGGPRFLLVRHGETDWNRDKRFQGQIDVPLNASGRAQSAKAAEFLKDVAIDAAVSSPMLRPKETAEIILQHHPGVTLTLEKDLEEISHGLWEGKFESDIEAEFPGMLAQWQDHPETVQMPEGENLQQVWARSAAAWERLVQQAVASGAKTTMVVAHDAVNKAILASLLGLGPEYFWCFKQGNGAVSVIDYGVDAQGKPVLMSSNITTHLASGVLDTTAAGAL